MTTLKLARQTYTGSAICEIWRDDQLIGTIYPAARGVTILSSQLKGRYTDVTELVPGPGDTKLVINILPDPTA